MVSFQTKAAVTSHGAARRGHCKNTSDLSFSVGLNLNELLFFCVS